MQAKNIWLSLALALLGFMFMAWGLMAQSEGEPGVGAGALTESSLNESSRVGSGRCTLELEMSGTIGPASVDLFKRGLKMAQDKGCPSLLVLINTPGGSLQSTRLIVEDILNSPIPILCLVHPTGGHAGSAGAIIMQACHVAGAMVATNMGAATPVAGGGQEIPEDLRKKLISDTRSWAEGLAKLRGRNEEFAKDIVTEAKAVSATEAFEIGAIDYLAERKIDFLTFAEGREVTLGESEKTLVQVGDSLVMPHDLRYRTLALVADPTLAYLILMGSLALLYYEITNPGTMVAGVVGGVGLVVALISLHKLEVVWGGLALMLLGLALLIAEAFMPSFGILGVGGIASFVLGSVFLFDPAETGYQLPLSLIISTSVILGLIMMGVGYLAVSSFKVKKKGGYDDIVGLAGEVSWVDESSPTKGQMMVHSELWRFESETEVKVGDRLEVVGYSGLTLRVRPESSAATKA